MLKVKEVIVKLILIPFTPKSKITYYVKCKNNYTWNKFFEKLSKKIENVDNYSYYGRNGLLIEKKSVIEEENIGEEFVIIIGKLNIQCYYCFIDYHESVFIDTFCSVCNTQCCPDCINSCC